ncbi:MAG TPA: carbamoyltransferase C-terminal domain-containing protein, partial [Tepidisphaeraceae bacterium]
FGIPRFVKKLEHLLKLEGDGEFSLDLAYFNFNARMYSPILAELLNIDPRLPDAPITRDHADIARSAQFLVEEVMLSLAKRVAKLTSSKKLCIGGGVALNCVANDRIRRSAMFSSVFVPPGAGDAGAAIGAGYLGSLSLSHTTLTGLTNAFLGPKFTSASIRSYLSKVNVQFEPLDDEALANAVADILYQGGFVGWFEGRMEFGPRALGARSILADPRYGKTRDALNSRIKRREEFRPFAPVCLASAARELFVTCEPEPYMTFTTGVRRPDLIEAVSHIDRTARPQIIDDSCGTRLAKLLKAFKARTGLACLINTSFNTAGEPIVCNPQDAFLGFREMGLDALVLEDVLVVRARQDPMTMSSGTRDYYEFARKPQPHVQDTYAFT